MKRLQIFFFQFCLTERWGVWYNIVIWNPIPNINIFPSLLKFPLPAYMQFLFLIRLWKCLQCTCFNEILVSAKTLHDKLKLLITSNYKLVWNSFHRLKTMKLGLLVNYSKFCFYWATYTKTNIPSILKNPDKIKNTKINCSCSYFIKPQTKHKNSLMLPSIMMLLVYGVIC